MDPRFKVRYLLFSIFTGLWTAPLIQIPTMLSLCVLGILFCMLVHKRSKASLYLFLFFLSHVYALTFPDYQASKEELSPFVHETVQVVGIVSNWPKISETHQQFHFDVLSLNNTPVKGTLLVKTTRAKAIKYGDKLQFSGKLKPPRNFEGFNYADYLERFQIQFVIDFPKELTHLPHQFVLSPLVMIKQSFEENITKVLPSPNAELAAGVLIGTKKDLPKPYKDAFKDAGLQHLIVVSGSNVAVIIVLCVIVFRRFGPVISTGLTVFILLCFLFITGGDPPVLRASILGIIATLALSFGRPIDTKNMLLLAAVLIGLYNPLAVQRDISFWLSFSATAGIILGFPLWQYYCEKLNLLNPLTMIFGVSFCAQMAVMPVLIMHFENFPWIGLVSNVFAEPLIPFTMMVSFIAGIGGVLPEILHQIVSFPAYVLTQLLNFIGMTFGAVPGLQVPDSIGKSLAAIWFVVFTLALCTSFHDRYLTNITEHYLDDQL